MILRIFLLACAIASPSFAKMNLATFNNEFGRKCFQMNHDEPFKINGQDTPLAQTLENFIALAEKFEAANPRIDLKDELAFFISKYLFENIKFVKGKASVLSVYRSKTFRLEKVWDPDQNGARIDPVNPFTDDENCSLYFMISHSLLEKDKEMLKLYSPGNDSKSFNSNRAYLADLDPNFYYPQELGVVAVRGTDAAVSLSKVLIGMYAGLNPKRKWDLGEFGFDWNQLKDETDLPTDKELDTVYATTLAEILVLSGLIEREGLAPNGEWVSTQLSSDKSIEGFCPMVYKQQKVTDNALPAYSYSSVRGAADGLILGLSIPQVHSKRTTVKLSQILRMYYSPEGIPLEENVDELKAQRVSFCNRQDLLRSAETKLHEQMILYGYAIAEDYGEVKGTVADSEILYQKDKGQIYSNQNTEIQNYCARPRSVEKPEELPRETFLDIIVVMDSSNSDNAFYEQQMIVGYLAKQLDLRYTGSRITILLDHRIDSNQGKGSTIELKPVVIDSYSSSCAACMVGQIVYEQSNVERDVIISAIDQLLQERKDNETQYSGANGKVVVYFNYEKDEGRTNSKVQGRLEQALRNLHLHHQDVLFYAVGSDSKVLLKYARFDPALFTLSTGDAYDIVANNILKKLTNAPALLQYSECKDGRNENSAVYENFVSPRKLQHYVMPAENFYKSTHLSMFFESQNGYIKVCYNRRTMRPENENYSCKNTTGTAAVEFKVSNPCQNFLKETCSPFYFSIMGMDSSPDAMRPDTRPRHYCDDINDHWCANLEQIKYKVSHTGIRCNGCLGLGAAPIIIMFSLLLTYFVDRRF